MAGRQLTPKQESFSFHVASGLNYTDAYRAAYNCAGSKPATVNRLGKREFDKAMIGARIDQLRREFRAESGITGKRVTEMLTADRSLAHDVRQAGAAVSATMGIAKVNGLLDRAEAVTAVNLTIEQSSPRDIAKAILRIMSQAADKRAEPAVIDHETGDTLT